jgi:regulator of protease activity HflC (stomatin/prohibitin superfamily)
MVKHFKGEPSEFVFKYHGKRIKKAGRGISFFYADYKTNIVAIPAVTKDAHFIFNEISKNYQPISLQGHYSYKITEFKNMTQILDYTIDPLTKTYKTTDPEKLELRITNVLQQLTRSELEQLELEAALAISNDLATNLLEKLNEAPIVKEMGIKVLSITFNSIRPTPEISKALEAEYRESLQKKADESIYERRAAAVEQERKIKENELNTDITLEKQKQELIALKSENKIKEAEVRSKVYELELNPYKKLEPKQLLAFALKELAFRSSKIGNLTITSEILSSLLKDKD